MFIKFYSFYCITDKRNATTMPGTKFVLTERFTQDPLEEFFGKQRSFGGQNDNPTIMQFVHNTTSLRVQRSIALEPVCGNCRKRYRSKPDVKDASQPLQKRLRRASKK